MATRRIGILTGGGDVPGLNSVIKHVVYRSAAQGIEVTGIRRGWEGLTHVNLDDAASKARYVLLLNRDNTRAIDRSGGTFLHSSRTNPGKMKKVPEVLAGAGFPQSGKTWDMSAQVLKNLERLQIDSLVAIGGDDTLSFAARLDQLGVKVIAVPKTMDNDVRNTEYCIGFSTAISRATAAGSKKPSLRKFSSHSNSCISPFHSRLSQFFIGMLKPSLPRARMPAGKRPSNAFLIGVG
jgi:6-phosphofructokinase 1